MLAGRGIGPFAGGAGTVIGAGEPHIEAAARGVPDVADDPVTARAASVGEVMAAHGLGIAREAARQIAAALITAHLRIRPRRGLRAPSSGWRSRRAARIAGPRSSAVGTKSRRRQAMISETRPSAFSCGDRAVGKAGELDAAARSSRAQRRSCRPPARSSTAPRSRTALQASSRREGRGPVDAEALIDAVERLGRHEAADHALAVIGLEAVDAHVRRPAAGPRSAAGGR